MAIEPGQSLRGEGVVGVLQKIQKEQGGPKRPFCDHGSEFSSQALDLWAYQNGVKIDFSRPGNRPTTGTSNRSMGRSGMSVGTRMGSRP